MIDIHKKINGNLFLNIFRCSFLCFLLVGCGANGQFVIPVSPSDWTRVSQGFRSDAKIVILPPSKNPKFLGYSVDDGYGKTVEYLISKDLDKIVGMGGLKIFLLSQNGRVVYDKYASDDLKNATPLGYSISKSLTSLAIGKMLCKNPEIGLHTRGKDIVPGFEGTSWGESTVEQILMMQSGSSRQEPKRGGWQSESVASRHRPIFWGRNNLDAAGSMKSDDVKEFEPGTSFQYNNYDTLFLGLIIEAVEKKPFYEFFQAEVWNQIGAGRPGAWFVNQKMQTYTYLGFSASPEDWIRIGNYVIDSMEKDDCFSNYLQKAAYQSQRSFVPTRCYGYQFWSWCNKDAFFFMGFGGQYLIMNPRKRWVAYAHQASDSNDAALIRMLMNVMGVAPVVER